MDSEEEEDEVFDYSAFDTPWVTTQLIEIIDNSTLTRWLTCLIMVSYRSLHNTAPTASLCSHKCGDLASHNKLKLL